MKNKYRIDIALCRLSLLVLITACSSPFPIGVNNYREYIGLKGKVRSVEQEQFELDSDGDPVRVYENKLRTGPLSYTYLLNRVLSNTYLEFSRSGKVMKWIEYTERGNYYLKFYNEGKSAIPSRIDIFKEDRYQYTLSFEYNKKRQRIDLKSCRDSCSDSFHYTYNEMKKGEICDKYLGDDFDSDSLYNIIVRLKPLDRHTYQKVSYSEQVRNDIPYQDTLYFNKYGDMIKSDKSDLFIEYEYDSKKNWTTRYFYTGDRKLLSVEKRTIVYY